MITRGDFEWRLKEELRLPVSRSNQLEIAQLLELLCVRKRRVRKDRRYTRNRARKLQFIDYCIEDCVKRNSECVQQCLREKWKRGNR